MVLFAEQIRAARSLLGWNQAELAKKADVSQMTVKRFEANNGPVNGTIASLSRIQNALESAGIHFIPPDETGTFGVRLTPVKKTKK